MNARLSHQPGDFVGPGKNQYRVLERIKSGGMGTVYKGENALTGSLFAVKEMDLLDDPRGKQISREQATAIFIDEARRIETLKHAGIPNGFLLVDQDVDLRICARCGNEVDPSQATCVICGHAPSSLYYRAQEIQARYYLFMQFIDGRDASEALLGTGKPPQGGHLHELVLWVRSVVEVLAYLHRRNLVHRDVKPENIRIANQGGAVYLLDYGLLVDLSAATAGGSPGGRLGTEGFAPPEQAAGRALPASDIYALAMTFLNLATGLDPANPIERKQLLTSQPLQLAGALPTTLSTLLSLSLDDNPAERPSADQWLHTLNRLDTPPTKNQTRVLAPDPTSRGDVPPRAPAPAGPQNLDGWLLRLGIARSGLILAIIALILLLWFWKPSFSHDTFEVQAQPGAVIYSRIDDPRQRTRLQGGERLMVRQSESGEGNWLRVVAVDGKRRKGFIDRGTVFRQRDPPR